MLVPFRIFGLVLFISMLVVNRYPIDPASRRWRVMLNSSSTEGSKTR